MKEKGNLIVQPLESNTWNQTAKAWNTAGVV